MFQNVFSWDHKGGKGPWGGGDTPSKKSPRRSSSGSDGEQVELDDLIRNAQDRMKGFVGGGKGGNGKGEGGFSPRAWMFIGLGVAVVWLGSGFYTVAPDEEGVVLRFGKYVETTTQGLNYRLPWPFETVIKPPVTRENIVGVGFRSSSPSAMFARSGFRADSSRGQGGVDVPQESLMLTGDENIVDLDFTVRWRIADSRAFLFNVANQLDVIKDAAESVMREVVGRHPIDDALTGNKGQIQTEVQNELQDVLDSYKAGVLISGVELQQVNPPEAVVNSFRDVQAARADAEKMQNEAIGYRNDILPRARGESAKIIQAAEAYKEAKVAKAQGEASRFESQLTEYRKAKDVTASRMYIESMEEVMQKADKVIMGSDAGRGVLPYLPLDKKGGQR